MCNGCSSIVALLQFYSISACIHLERPFLPILLLEEPCSSVRSLVTYFTPFACAIDQQLWIWGRASTGACVTRPGREGRYQAGPKGCSLEVGARRAPRLLVYTYILSRFLGSLTALFICSFFWEFLLVAALHAARVEWKYSKCCFACRTSAT